MKRVRLCLLTSLLICLCLFLNGCNKLDESLFLFLNKNFELDETLALKICGAYAVPGMMHFDLKGVETDCTKIEEDAEGRILFEWSGYNMISDETSSYLVICQAINSDYVFYYEDICYITKTDNPERIEDFKNLNDWEMPFDKEQISFRPKKASFDLYLVPEHVLHNDAIEAAFSLEIGEDLRNGYESFLVDVSPSGQELHCAKANSHSKEEIILFVVSSSTNCTATKISSLDTVGNSIKDLKEKAHWQYGASDHTGPP